MLSQQHNEHAAEVYGEQRHGDGGEDGPDDQGVPLPVPDLMDELEGVVAEVLQLLAVHGELAGVKEMDAELDEGDKEQKVQWRDDVCADE